MTRLLTALALVAFLVVVSNAEPNLQSPKESRPMLTAVFHVNFGDAERQGHGLNNIENVLKEAEDAQIVVVCHGEGISLVEKSRTKNADDIQALMKKGVRFVACENTMAKKSLEEDDLVPGTATVPSGAVEVILKQSEGYSYFRP